MVPPIEPLRPARETGVKWRMQLQDRLARDVSPAFTLWRRITNGGLYSKEEKEDGYAEKGQWCLTLIKKFVGYKRHDFLRNLTSGSGNWHRRRNWVRTGVGEDASLTVRRLGCRLKCITLPSNTRIRFRNRELKIDVLYPNCTMESAESQTKFWIPLMKEGVGINNYHHKLIRGKHVVNLHVNGLFLISPEVL